MPWQPVIFNLFGRDKYTKFFYCVLWIGSRHGLIVLGMDTNNKGIVMLKLGTKNSRSKEGRQEKNGGVKRRDGNAEELDRETGGEQTTMGRTRRKDGG